MIKRVLICAALFGTVLAGARAAEPMDPYHGLTADQFHALLNTKDAALLAFRLASMATDSKNPVVCNGLRSLWLQQRNATVPEAAQSLAKQTEVRIALAATLGRCEGAPGEDPGYRAYVISVIQNPEMDGANRRRASANLGIIGDDRDVPLLRGLAMDSSDLQVALGAVGGLSAMKSAAARSALNEIANAPGIHRSVSSTAQRVLQN